MTYQQYQASPPTERPRTSAGTSSPSYTQRIMQRMTREEAIKAVVRMMSAYTGYRALGEELLVLAEVLMGFPLETATAAASPIHGAPKKYRDKPVKAGQLTEWCEHEAEWLYQQARLERGRLPAPGWDPPTEAERLKVQAKLQEFLKGVRPGGRVPRQPRHSETDRQAAQEFLDKCAAERFPALAQLVNQDEQT